MTRRVELLTESLTPAYADPMLRYLSHGERRYDSDPIPIYRRGLWEFQAVVRGRCAPSYPNLREEYSDETLWIFSPGNAHGWTGVPGESCEIVVFHFDKIPDIMRILVPPDSVAGIRLSRREIGKIRRIYRSCRGCLHRSDIRSELISQSALLELCLILAERTAPTSSYIHPSRQTNLVMSSLAWYEEHMSSGPSLRQVAKETNVSTSHMRRVYWAVLHRSPSKEFALRRISQAKYLLEITSMTVSEIAFATGYGSVSSFSRAFHNASAVSPKIWRQRYRHRPENWA